jgi:hypothetical protein
VREQGRISVFAVVGFLAVGLFAALVLMSYVRLTTLIPIRLSAQRAKHPQDRGGQASGAVRAGLRHQEHRGKVTADGQMVNPRAGRSTRWTYRAGQCEAQ